MKALDLFTGYGGITMALKGYTEPIAYVEIEEYAQRIIAERMADGSIPRAPLFADVKNIQGSLGLCDIIYGGFPCQDISVAGNGKGLAGERSGLFFEVIRLTKEIRPSFVFLENVPAIRTKGLEQVIKAFTEVGYDCRWTCLSAASVGAPHKRERWFLLAYSKSNGNRGKLRELFVENEKIQRPKMQYEKRPNEFNNASYEPQSLANSNCMRKSPEQKTGQIPFDRTCDSSSNVADSVCERLEGQRNIPIRIEEKLNHACDSSWWAIEPNVGRVVNGTPFELDFIEEIKIDEKINDQKTESKISNISKSVLQTMWENREIAASSSNLYRERFYNCLPDLPQRNSQGRGNMGSWFERDKDLCDMLNEFCSQTLDGKDLQSRLLKKLREIKCAETLEKSFRTDRIKALGNGVVPLQVRTAFEKLMGLR